MMKWAPWRGRLGFCGHGIPRGGSSSFQRGVHCFTGVLGVLQDPASAFHEFQRPRGGASHCFQQVSALSSGQLGALEPSGATLSETPRPARAQLSSNGATGGEVVIPL